MLKELEDLVKLQRIDNQLMRITGLKGDLPQLVDALSSELGELEKSLDADKERMEEVKKMMKQLESKIEEDKVKLEKYQDQLYLVTSNKEYDAITAEIDYMKQEISKAEYEILELSEELEKLNESIKNKEIAMTEKKKELEEKKAELKNTDEKTKEEESKLRKDREVLVERIPIRYLREYERVAKARNGVAVVPISQVYEVIRDKNGNIIDQIEMEVSCGGCHKIVPPQKFIEIKAGDKIFRCESCGRLLYWDEKESVILKDDLHEDEEFI